ncbi:MAG TPA: transcription elongation factor GreA [Caldilineae bacterium]|nr:transcription elongation factor GreA [Caldilineae bacterium]
MTRNNNGNGNNDVYLTPEGLQKLQEELEWREKVRRPEIALQTKAAIKEGDLSENAGYDEAKYQAGMNEGRIKELQQKIKNAVLIETNDGPAEFVELGRTVTVKDLEFGDEEIYTIVGSAEADPGNGKISNESPMGVALMGQRVGATVLVESPGGQLQFEVLKIE